MEVLEVEENNNCINTIIMKSNKLRICCITWNMHGLLPTDNQIRLLLDPHKNYDIYNISEMNMPS